MSNEDGGESFADAYPFCNSLAYPPVQWSASGKSTDPGGRHDLKGMRLQC